MVKLVGLVGTNSVSHLAALRGHDVEQVIDNLGGRVASGVPSEKTKAC